MTIKTVEKNALMQDLAVLKQDHRDLDLAITNMAEQLQSNQLEITRLKKQKLKLKDSIAKLESRLIPDLHA